MESIKQGNTFYYYIAYIMCLIQNCTYLTWFETLLLLCKEVFTIAIFYLRYMMYYFDK